MFQWLWLLEARHVFVDLYKAAKFMLKNWKPRKFESFCSPSGNPVLPLLVFTPLTSLDVMQEQMQLTVMRKLNLRVPALSGLLSEFVVGFGAICYTSTIRKAIPYFCWAFYLSAVAKGALLQHLGAACRLELPETTAKGGPQPVLCCLMFNSDQILLNMSYFILLGSFDECCVSSCNVIWRCAEQNTLTLRGRCSGAVGLLSKGAVGVWWYWSLLSTGFWLRLLFWV